MVQARKIDERPVVVVGAHAQGLLLRVVRVPGEGETVVAHGFDEPLDGGKATNQAVAAAKLGAPVSLVTLVGGDERGRRARDAFARFGIDVRGVVEVEGATDVGFILLPPSGVPAIATAIDRNLELDAAFVERAAAIVREGSVCVCQLEAPQEAAIAAFRIAREAGALTILNPAPPAELEPELVALTDVLVPNEHEAAFLGGDAAELAARFGCAVVVTVGERGAFDGVRYIPAPEVEAVDTTGAGDAFVGALAARLRAGDALVEAVRFAVRAASLSVTRPGTMPSYATAVEVASPLASRREDARRRT